MGLYDLDWEAAEQLLASGVLEQDTAPSRAPSVLSTVEQYGYSEAALLQAMASHSLSTYGEASTFLDDQARKAFEHTPIVISPLPLASSQSSLDLARRLQEEEQRSEKARQEKASREVIARLKEEERLAEQERQERASLELIARLQEEEKRTPTFSGSFPSESGVLSMEEIRRIARENVGRENIEFVVNGRRYTPQTFLESHPETKLTAIGTGQMQFNKREGHFYFPGEITWNSGSCSMEFMYDTGATDTSISQFAARKFFGVEIEDFDLTVHTANGEGKAARFLLPKLVVTDGENGFTF